MLIKMLRLTRLLGSNAIGRVDSSKFATLIKLPSLSPTMSEGGIVEWHKNEGDKVSAGDLICDIQTDKAVVGLEAEEDGILAKIIRPKDSQNLPIGEVIGVMADTNEDWRSVAMPAISVAVKTDVAPPSADISAKSSLDKFGPAVRRLLDDFGLTADAIVRSESPHGVLTKTDVLQHIAGDARAPSAPPGPPIAVAAAAATTSASPPPFTDIPLSNMRAVIAKRLTASRTTVPHWFSTGEASITAIMAARQCGTVKLSVNDFVVKACAFALRLVPDVNNGLNADGSINVNRAVDISVAVASERGLITPIVFGADKLSLVAIHGAVEALAKKARDNKLQPKEFQGGTFTISNLGMFGVKQFTAIINAPQSAILAVGAGIRHLAVDNAGAGRTRQSPLQWDTRMRFTLCADARAIDEIAAARFVSCVKTYLENPHFLLADSSADADDDRAAAWSY